MIKKNYLQDLPVEHCQAGAMGAVPEVRMCLGPGQMHSLEKKQDECRCSELPDHRTNLFFCGNLQNVLLPSGAFHVDLVFLSIIEGKRSGRRVFNLESRAANWNSFCSGFLN